MEVWAGQAGSGTLGGRLQPQGLGHRYLGRLARHAQVLHRVLKAAAEAFPILLNGAQLGTSGNLPSLVGGVSHHYRD